MFNLNRATTCTDAELAEVMNFKPWNEQQVQKGVAVRTALSAALKVIIETVPPSPDRSAAIRKLREARMDCNSAITFDGEL
jgi:hypothetical protein